MKRMDSRQRERRLDLSFEPVVRHLALGLALFVVPAVQVAAQPGTLDTSFGTNGAIIVPFDLGGSLTDVGNAIALQSDGKTVMAGYASVGSQFDMVLTRLTVDGQVDNAFSGGRVSVAFDRGGGDADLATSVAVAPDGKIVVAGFSDGVDSRDFALARLTSSGTLDTTFDLDGLVTVGFPFGTVSEAAIAAVALQPDGKIVACGFARRASQATLMAVARLNLDGSLDTTFSGDGRATVDFGPLNTDCTALAVQPDGAVVLAGWTTSASGPHDFAVARLSAAGNLDTTFDSDGRVTIDFPGIQSDDFGEAVALDSRGRIVIAGSAKAGGSFGDMAVARLLANGALDSSFSGDGRASVDIFTGNDDFANAVVVDPSGVIALGGMTFTNGPSGEEIAFARLREDGSLDSRFGNAGTLIVAFDLGDDNADQVTAMAARPAAGGLLAGGTVARSAAGDTDFVLLQLIDDQLFADGFESGDTLVWSSTVP